MTEYDIIIDKLKTRIFYLESNIRCYIEIINNKNTDIKLLKSQLKYANDKLRIYKEVNYKQYCIEDY
ncbi:MAG: hypothetical protein HFI36_04740 [Bacilli bacterium]|nr:hypothetical protein [Bacilli bacterium]